MAKESRVYLLPKPGGYLFVINIIMTLFSRRGHSMHPMKGGRKPNLMIARVPMATPCLAKAPMVRAIRHARASQRTAYHYVARIDRDD
jgi:hypothetical protein